MQAWNARRYDRTSSRSLDWVGRVVHEGRREDRVHVLGELLRSRERAPYRDFVEEGPGHLVDVSDDAHDCFVVRLSGKIFCVEDRLRLFANAGQAFGDRLRFLEPRLLSPDDGVERTRLRQR